MGESVDVMGGYAEEDAVFDEMGLGKWFLISVLKSGGNAVSVYMLAVWSGQSCKFPVGS